MIVHLLATDFACRPYPACRLQLSNRKWRALTRSRCLLTSARPALQLMPCLDAGGGRLSADANSPQFVFTRLASRNTHRLRPLKLAEMQRHPADRLVDRLGNPSPSPAWLSLVLPGGGGGRTPMGPCLVEPRLSTALFVTL